MRFKKTAATSTAILGALAYTELAEHEIKTSEDVTYTAYITGSPLSGHDQAVAEAVEGNVTMSSYCQAGVLYLQEKEIGDVVFKPYANSYNCRFKSSAFPTIPIIGGDNDPTNNFCKGVHDYPDAIVISNGDNWGNCIDYHVAGENGEYVSLSFAYPIMANYIFQINSAREERGLAPVHTHEIKKYLDDSSAVFETKVYEGGVVLIGQRIDLEKAIELATGQPTPSTKGFLPSIYQLLL